MKGSLLRFYMHENRRQDHILLYEWLLEQAKDLGIEGGSAFRAIAGFGRHGILHEQHFFELAGNLTVTVEFLTSDEEAEKILHLIRDKNVSLVYARLPAELAVINGSH